MVTTLAMTSALCLSWPCAHVAQDAQGSALASLVQRCAAGRIDRPFVRACFDVIREDAAFALGDGAVSKDLFEWIERTSQLSGDAYLAIATAGPKVASNLAQMRAFDEGVVEANAALAVAYAAAWSNGDGAEPQQYWVDDWLVRGRDVPTMVESFDDHVTRRRKLRVPVRRVPWQVLAHLADSEVPIVERAWAVETYGERETPELRNLFGAVPYTLEPKRGDTPCTLESFLEIGGACTHNVQFADGVFTAFGIPAGWAGGPGHTYPYWFEMERNELSVHRTNEIGNRNGKIRDPLSSGHVWEDDLRLMVRGLNRSVASYRDASLAAWAYERVPKADKTQASAILLAGVRANPMCVDALNALAEGTAERHLSASDAGSAWRVVAKALDNHPHFLAPLLDRALPALEAKAPTFDGDLALLAKLERDWKKTSNEEALARISVWRARAAAARAPESEAHAIRYSVYHQRRGDADGLGEPPTLIGGGGGAPFLHTGTEAAGHLIGLRIAPTGFSGHTVIGSVQGIYANGDTETFGERTGGARAGEIDLRAPKGWRVCGLIARGGDRVDALQLVYIRAKGGSDQVRLSEWFGTPTGTERLIGGTDCTVTGIRGRAGADVDAVGLVGHR